MNKYLKICLGLIGLVFLLTLKKLANAPDRFLHQLESAQNHELLLQDSIYNFQSLDSLVHTLAYKQALLKLAGEDSIQLVLNIPDNTASLYIHGVPIFSSRFVEVNVDPMLKKLPNSLHRSAFGVPLMVKSIQSTTVKEPIVERQAPKNPEEAALNAYMPDTLIQQPAFVQMVVDHGILIQMEQSQDEAWQDYYTKWRFNNEIRFSRLGELINSIFTFGEYIYQPKIYIGLPQDDLRAIYRALPSKAHVVVNF